MVRAKNFIIALGWLLMAACSGQHSQTSAHIIADTMAVNPQPHTLTYDSSFCAADTDGTKELPDFTGLDKAERRYVESKTQYKIWLRRQRQMKQWATQYEMLNLPANASIIDLKPFSTLHGQRTIIAWMTRMEAHVDPSDDVYLSPDVTIGKGYFLGSLHLSLINNAQHAIINTIRVYRAGSFERSGTIHYFEGCLYYPFAIANPEKRKDMWGLIYHVIGGTDSTEGEADILHFIDFNGDGKKYEIALFEQFGSALKWSTLIAYQEKADSLKWCMWDMQEIATTPTGKDTTYTATEHWLADAMTYSFNQYGTIHYSRDFRGRGGNLEIYYLNYDSSTDKYTGVLDARDQPEGRRHAHVVDACVVARAQRELFLLGFRLLNVGLQTYGSLCWESSFVLQTFCHIRGNDMERCLLVVVIE